MLLKIGEFIMALFSAITGTLFMLAVVFLLNILAHVILGSFLGWLITLFSLMMYLGAVIKIVQMGYDVSGNTGFVLLIIMLLLSFCVFYLAYDLVSTYYLGAEYSILDNLHVEE